MATGTDLKTFARAQDGAVTVETAIVAVPLFLILLALAELLVFFTLAMSLEAATEASRAIRTGQFQSSASVSRAAFKQAICQRMPVAVDCQARLSVEVRTFDSFGDAAAYAGKTTADFAQVDLEADPTGFDDVATCFSVGAPKDIVMVRTYYRAPLVTALFARAMANIGGERLLTAATTFRNEPYSSDPRTGADACYAA
jgi:Flp pilus assembly protein TadG